jgi:hypothetical protein
MMFYGYYSRVDGDVNNNTTPSEVVLVAGSQILPALGDAFRAHPSSDGGPRKMRFDLGPIARRLT